MNTIILTGSPWIGTEQLSNRLPHFGINHALAGQYNKIPPIRNWHDKIFSSKQPYEGQQLHLGKAWEQLAGEIFLANWEQKQWGWADSRSTWLLDFWRDFDPNIYFILIHVHPQRALAQAITQIDGQTPFAVDKTITTWLAYERELLRFYLRNPQRCLLVNLEEVDSNPALLAEAANKLFNLELDTRPIALETPVEPVATSFNPLISLLAEHALQQFPEALGLWEEISVSLTLLQTTEQAGHPEQTVQISDAITELRSIIHSADIALDTMTHARDEQRTLVLNCQAQIDQLASERDNQIKVVLKCQNQIEKLNQEGEDRQAHINLLERERDSYAKITTDVRQGNELLLLQFHQVQEEQEQYFLKNLALENDLKANDVHLANERKLAEERQVQINQLRNDRDHQARIASERQQQLAQDRDAKVKQVEERQAQINQLMVERDQQAKLATGYQQQLEQLAKDRDAQTQLLERHKTHINHLEHERDNYVKATTDARQGNELLLLQLHQVQEDLEHYFLQHLQEQKLKEEVNHRLVRILGRLPSFVDMEELHIVQPVGKESQEISLTATDVYHASRRIEQYTLRVQINNKNAAIIIERPDVQLPNPLLRWPVELTNKTAIVIPANPDNAISGLSYLPTSDWQFLQVLSQTFVYALRQGHFQLSGDVNKKFNPAIWQQALTQLSFALQEDTDCLRYDRVRLKREQVNPDYEHLWLHISNLHYKGKQWPSTEFRLGASLVNKKEFSIHPKLEFPQLETGLPLFENWQPDLEDDYGLKMELRFEIKSQAIDINFWNSLSSADHSLLLALISHVPLFLADLEAQKITLNRPWQDWHSLVQGTLATINARSVELGIEPSFDVGVVAA